MAATWPASLQQFLNDDNFSLALGDTTIRQNTDTGPSKVRSRFSKPINKLTASIVLPSSEYDTFYNFYYVTLNGGVDPFDFDDPITGVTKEYSFVETPKIGRLGGENFTASMLWEVVD